MITTAIGYEKQKAKAAISGKTTNLKDEPNNQTAIEARFFS